MVTSTNKNIQYDIYNDTKDVLKAVRKENEERLQNQLVSQGLSLVSLIIPHPHSTPYGHPFKANFRKTSLTSLFGISITHFRQEKNLSKWGLSSTSDCSFCSLSETLLHIVAGCETYLNEGRFTWRHDSVLNLLASTLTAVQNSRLYVDIPGFVNPSVLTGDNLRPDLLLAIENECLYILELTVGFESNLQVNANRKRQKYLDLIEEQKTNYDKVKFIKLSLSTLGVFSRSSENFDEMLRSLKLDDQYSKYIKKKIVNMCTRTSYIYFVDETRSGLTQN